jgi:hypothetical protein
MQNAYKIFYFKLSLDYHDVVTSVVDLVYVFCCVGFFLLCCV